MSHVFDFNINQMNHIYFTNINVNIQIIFVFKNSDVI